MYAGTDGAGRRATSLAGDAVSLFSNIIDGGAFGAVTNLANAFIPGLQDKRSQEKNKFQYEAENEMRSSMAREKSLSPEAARRASAMALQSGATNAMAGGLNAAQSANLSHVGGAGDASISAVAQGANAMAGAMGARAPFDQAIATGFQTALGQKQEQAQSLINGSEAMDRMGFNFIQNLDKGKNLMSIASTGASLGKSLFDEIIAVGTENEQMNQESEIEKDMSAGDFNVPIPDYNPMPDLQMPQDMLPPVIPANNIGVDIAPGNLPKDVPSSPFEPKYNPMNNIPGIFNVPNYSSADNRSTEQIQADLLNAKKMEEMKKRGLYTR